MATAKDFVARVDQIDGVDGCLLVKKDGSLLGQTLDDYKTYANLMAAAGEQAYNLMDRIGFSYCRHLCFNCRDNRHFYLFPIDNYLLGVVQESDCDVSEMLESVYDLVSRVSTTG